MADRIPGINFTGPVVPNLESDTYPSHYAKYGKGGWREVATIAERDAISNERREAGMAVYVTSEEKVYILNDDLTTWVEFKPGQGNYIRKSTNLSTLQPLVSNEIVQYVGSYVGHEVPGYFYQAGLSDKIVIGDKSSDRIYVNITNRDALDAFIQELLSLQPTWDRIGRIQVHGTYDEGIKWNIFYDSEQPETPTIRYNSTSLTKTEVQDLLGISYGYNGGSFSENSWFNIDNNQVVSWTQIDVQPATDLTWGNITGDITNQTDLNTELTGLQDQIDSLSGRGRYLTLWNCSTGLAETNPPESPYEYRTGDYFIVGTVAASGGTNYRPDGTSYTTGTASTVVETEEVAVDDTYIFDGSTWHLQYNSQKTVSFANIAGQPTDNTNLATALDAKADVSSIGDATLTITKSGVAVGSFSANATEDVTLDVDTDILPTQTGNEGKFLKTDGSHASWQEVKPIVWVSYVDE